MIGPKLDARSYAILVLAAIGVLMGGSLIAQNQSQYQATQDLASATRQVAQATEGVARSNAQIAEAIQSLSSAVRELGRQRGPGQPTTLPAPVPAPADGEMMIRPGDAANRDAADMGMMDMGMDDDPGLEPSEPIFELN